MPTPTFDDAIYEDGQQFKDDAKLAIRFFKHPVKLEHESISQGRPIFKDFDYIEIIVPGSRDNLVTEVTDQYKTRFRRQWENYLARQEQTIPGTPLSELTWLTKSQVLEFNGLNIQTVEQLASLSDMLAQKFMGAHDIRKRAQRYLEQAADQAPMLKMEEELRKRDETIQAQAEQLQAMQEAIKALQDKDKAKQVAKV